MYTVFLAENYQIYGLKRCICSVLANPTGVPSLWVGFCSSLTSLTAVSIHHMCVCVCVQGKLESKAENLDAAEAFYKEALRLCEVQFGKGATENGSPIYVSPGSL